MPRRAAPCNRNRDRLNEIRPSDAERSANPAILLAPDLDALFRQGQRRLRQKAALAHVLWKRATAMQPPPKHCFLQDTLHSLRDFPARYDWRFFAQEIRAH